MKISFTAVMLLLLAFPTTTLSEVQGPSGSPLISSVEPASGKAGDQLTVQGASLGRDVVAALYLTDGQSDTKVAITEQTPTSITFKIPPEVKPGRFALMVLTRGEPAKLIEEPVKVTVESEPGRPET